MTKLLCLLLTLLFSLSGLALGKYVSPNVSTDPSPGGIPSYSGSDHGGITLGDKLGINYDLYPHTEPAPYPFEESDQEPEVSPVVRAPSPDPLSFDYFRDKLWDFAIFGAEFPGMVVATGISIGGATDFTTSMVVTYDLINGFGLDEVSSQSRLFSGLLIVFPYGRGASLVDDGVRVVSRGAEITGYRIGTKAWSGSIEEVVANSVDKSWKLKIYGSAQKTGPGHQFRSYREAIAEAKNPDVRAVHLDHGYNRALGLTPKTISPNRRPDVLSIYNDGTVKRIEVQSITDRPAFLRSRNSALDQQLIDQGFTPTPPVVVRPH
jgi:hypothetical protein